MTKILTMNSGISYLMWWVNLYLVHFSKIQAQCSGNGLKNGCACNFINACKWDSSSNNFSAFGGSASDLGKFIPNLSHLATSPLHIAEICEPGSLGIIYDCKNRIPIAATIVISVDQYESRTYNRPATGFRESSEIGSNFQQNDIDYTDASQRILCIETSGGDYCIEHTWFTGGNVAPYAVPCPQNPPKTSIHRGHLIAASYGRGTPDRSAETFVYTNAVPQFGRENSGSWRSFESKLLKWANDNCGGAPLHVIVGSIPSTYQGNSHRFFGQAGFSDYDGPSKIFDRNPLYRVNVPEFLWTAACCHSDSPSFTKSTAFCAPNKPKRGLVGGATLSKLFAAVRATPIDLFPGMPSCKDDKNYISV